LVESSCVVCVGAAEIANVGTLPMPSPPPLCLIHYVETPRQLIIEFNAGVDYIVETGTVGMRRPLDQNPV